MSPAGNMKHAPQDLAQQIFPIPCIYDTLSCGHISMWSNLVGQFLFLLQKSLCYIAQ